MASDTLSGYIPEDELDQLLMHICQAVPKNMLCLPGPDVYESTFMSSNRSPQVLRNLAAIYNNGRLGHTGYLSILPVDQDVEHSAGSAFGPNPIYFDPENIIRLAMQGGCNAVATTFGHLALFSRNYAHKIPFIVKINHNELLTYPNKYDQVMFGSVKSAWELGAAAVGATIYFGSQESSGQITEVARAFEEAHALGMATILWCYTRNAAFVKMGVDYNTAADLTGQANHLGATIQADIVKQKLPTVNGGFTALQFGKTSPVMYDGLTTSHPIDLCRYQVLNSYAGRIGLINSGGDAKGKTDMGDALKAAIINKRAGGTGLIMGRKAFQRPFAEGVGLLHAVQDIYLDKSITIA